MSKTNLKRYLMLLGAIGLVAVVGGSSGTFASFNAQVTNTGNYFATGSLFLHDTTGGTTCTSESSSTNLNNGSLGDTCHTVFALQPTNSNAQFAVLTLKNAGTLNANGIKFALANACQNLRVYQTNTTLSAGVSSGATTLPINPATLAIQAGGHIELTDGTQTEVVTALNAVHVGDTSITLSSGTANTYTSSSPVTNVESTADFGTSSLCSHLDVSITEVSSATPSITENNTGTDGGLGCAYGTAAGDSLGCTFSNTNNLSTLPVGQGNLTPLTINTAAGGNTSGELDAGLTRYFVIGLKEDATALTNADQDTKATFDLLWNLDQV